MSSYELLTIVLRAFAYTGSIAIGGGLLFALTFPKLVLAESLRRQLRFGAVLLLLIEPLRYLVFQLSAMGGDMGAAFGADQRWLAMQTAFGQASFIRFVGAAIVAAVPRPANILTSLAGIAILGSFALEGHTAAEDTGSIVLSFVLIAHLAAVHWWLGSLYPLRSLLSTEPARPEVVQDFGRRAGWIVAILVIAGAILLGSLTKWTIDADSAYQQRFALKLGLVASLLAVAAMNKLWLTPRLLEVYQPNRMRASIAIEIFLAATILLATAYALSVGPAVMYHS